MHKKVIQVLWLLLYFRAGYHLIGVCSEIMQGVLQECLSSLAYDAIQILWH